MASDVERIYREFTELIAFLAEKDEISLRSAADDTFRKALILSAASYFEHLLTNIVMEFVREVTSSESLVTSLVQGEVVSRKYHSWFAWDARNANRFFKMFGEQFKTHMLARVQSSPDLDKAIKAFLELGEARNMVAHQNFAAFAMEKTSDEIFQLYKDAAPFVECMRTELRKCSAKLRPAPHEQSPNAEQDGPHQPER